MVLFFEKQNLDIKKITSRGFGKVCNNTMRETSPLLSGFDNVYCLSGFLLPNFRHPPEECERWIGRITPIKVYTTNFSVSRSFITLLSKRVFRMTPTLTTPMGCTSHCYHLTAGYTVAFFHARKMTFDYYVSEGYYNHSLIAFDSTTILLSRVYLNVYAVPASQSAVFRFQPLSHSGCLRDASPSRPEH